MAGPDHVQFGAPDAGQANAERLLYITLAKLVAAGVITTQDLVKATTNLLLNLMLDGGMSSEEIQSDLRAMINACRDSRSSASSIWPLTTGRPAMPDDTRLSRAVDYLRRSGERVVRLARPAGIGLGWAVNGEPQSADEIISYADELRRAERWSRRPTTAVRVA